MSWGGIVGRQLKPTEIHDYVSTIKWDKWKPDFIVVHNTAAPSLASRPNGFTAQGIKNLESYYKNDRGWPSGPHFFVDDNSVWVFSPPNARGTHSPSWNGVAIGIEMLGDYSVEEFTSGRGAKVRSNTVTLVASLLKCLGLPASAWRYHNQDPKTDHDCPGKKARADKAGFQADISRRHMALGMQPPKKPNVEIVDLKDLDFPETTMPPWGEWITKDRD